MPKEGGDKTLDALAELEEFAGVPRAVTVTYFPTGSFEPQTKVVRVAPMTYNVCALAAAPVRSIVEKLGTTIRADDLPQLLVDHADALRAIVAIATEEPDAFIGNLPLDQFGILSTAVFEVNRDFFVRRVGPIYKALALQMFGGDGPMLSTVSQSTGT